MKYLIATILLFFSFSNLYPQLKIADSSFSNMGLFFDYNLNQHTANFQKLPGVPNCCPRFESGSGSGITIGLVYEYAFYSSLSAQVRANYTGIGAVLTKTEPEVMSLNGNAVDGEFTHSLDAKLATIGVSPMVAYRLFDNFKIAVGVDIGYLATRNYSQVEKITKPSGVVTFIDSTGKNTGKFTRNELSGEIPGTAKILFSGLASISYELPLNASRSLLLIPEISYRYGFNNIANDLVWKTNSLRFGLALAYTTAKYIKMDQYPSFEKDNKILAMENEIEVVGNPSDLIYGAFDAKENEKLSSLLESGLHASVKAVGISEGVESSDFSLHLEEFLSTNMRPLLNYVFFDDNSSDLPKRYVSLSKEQSKDFKIEKLNKETTISTYYYILNIIGKRMKDYPDAKITLTGCISDINKEKGNKDLSRKRAETVAEYLKTVWNIDAGRISVTSRGLPEISSSSKDKDGIEENRRVEISCTNPEIMKPVIADDTLIMASPTLIRFYPSTKSESQIAGWTLKLEQGDKLIKEFSKEGDVDKKIDIILDAKDKEKLRFSKEPIFYSLEVRDKSNNTTVSKQSEIKLDLMTLRNKRESKSGDEKIDKYSLILFKYNSAELSADNASIANYIKQRLQPNSKVDITGYTDRMGDENDNILLSEERAKGLKKVLAPKAFVRGLGESELIFDNELPEGRFYSRTVVVDVRTPIKW